MVFRDLLNYTEYIRSEVSSYQLARLAGLPMQFDLSASDRVTMNGWVQIPCP